MSKLTAEELLRDFFLNDSCGLGGSEDSKAFYSWCSGSSNEEKITTICKIVTSELMRCNVTMSFFPSSIKTKPYFDSYEGPIPEGIEYSVFCYNDIQPQKSLQWEPAQILFPKDGYLTYNKVCYQTLFGVSGLSWWILLLIVLACLLTVSGAAYLFWKYWLERVLYPPKSTMNSMLTSSPISATSEMVNSRRPPKDSSSSGKIKRKKVPGHSSALIVGRQPTSTLMSRSNEPTVRSGSSHNRSRSSSRGRATKPHNIEEMTKTNKGSSITDATNVTSPVSNKPSFF